MTLCAINVGGKRAGLVTMLSECGFPSNAVATEFTPHGRQESYCPTLSINLSLASACQHTYNKQQIHSFRVL